MVYIAGLEILSICSCVPYLPDWDGRQPGLAALAPAHPQSHAELWSASQAAGRLSFGSLREKKAAIFWLLKKSVWEQEQK